MTLLSTLWEDSLTLAFNQIPMWFYGIYERELDTILGHAIDNDKDCVGCAEELIQFYLEHGSI